MEQSQNSMSVVAAIYGRHSVRNYTPEQLDRDTINVLLAAAVRAPTAIHKEPWAFVVVQDAALLRRISDCAKAFLSQEIHHAGLHTGSHALDTLASSDTSVFYSASTLIVICADTTGAFFTADCWLAAENLMLAAHARGLGTCVIGCAVSALNSAELKAELGLPVGTTAIAPIIVGVPADETSPTERKEPRILAWK